MDDERINFSALEVPAGRWEALVQRTLERSRPAPPTVWTQLPRLRGAVFALAALALLSWVPALSWSNDELAETAADPAVALMQYSVSGDPTALLESAHGW